MDHDNKRNYFRIDLSVPVKWQILGNPEMNLVKKGLGCTLLTHNPLISSPLEEHPEQIPLLTKDHQLYRSFQLLHNKIDYIIKMLSESEGSSTRDNIIEISGSGLKFRTMETLDAGIFLKMNLILPGNSCFQMEFIAETLRVENLDSGYIVAAKIICIDDDTRDFIVKIIFEKQRNDIRKLKTNQEVSNSD